MSTLVAHAGLLAIVFQAAQGAAGVLGKDHFRRQRCVRDTAKPEVPGAGVIAWLTLSSALLITLLPRGRFSRGVGAYLVASVATFVIGITGTFERIVDKLPVGISTAMLAGILLGFAAE
ncbi:hypothetical protein FY140_06950 [Agrobacterium tumefaciens]|uniref:benzoate/H(+) symporter BenE family transporter n=1 Tax=Agrobacterium tumefaciens TaxID=358 RepID=UPI001572B741|nr:benzoate/H(+) symporter BenE family transporter [Agrobacterium tumefaciens]UXT20465.1 hypothetical protein FY140_06950 [Agrobacterium tumefaciens]WHO20742.1 benzoate/H(+) symporter BenE family transporter [Agrobacterium tumefaciens]WHO23527.1 benzoate/H(+) symporter BenE family transporter [Agrobacterium tumefaciens]